VQRQAVSDIYTRDHSRYHLLIVTLLASLSLGGAKLLGSSLYTGDTGGRTYTMSIQVHDLNKGSAGDVVHRVSLAVPVQGGCI
jgi:hypothetical protein